MGRKGIKGFQMKNVIPERAGWANVLYLREMEKKYPTPLSQEEQRELVLKAQAGDRDARHELVYSCWRFNEKFCVHNYQGKGLALEDLRVFGLMGLDDAVDGFDVTREVGFLTYAKTKMQTHLNRALDEYSKTVRAGQHPRNCIREMYKCYYGDAHRLQRELTDAEYSERLNKPERDIHLFRCATLDSKSLDEHVKIGDDEGCKAVDLISSYSPSPTRAYEIEAGMKILEPYVVNDNRFPPCGYEILCHMYGFHGTMPKDRTLIIKKSRLPTNTFNRILAECIKRLRKWIREKEDPNALELAMSQVKKENWRSRCIDENKPV